MAEMFCQPEGGGGTPSIVTIINENTRAVTAVKFASFLEKENGIIGRGRNTIVINYRTYLVYCVDETSFSLFTSNKQKVRLNISKVNKNP